MHYPLDKGRKTNEYKGLVTHNDILKIYRIIKYFKNIFKCNMVTNMATSITWTRTLDPDLKNQDPGPEP